eukprot:CAMPEP_0116014124 /NCGR_PEP_ID=MMETSP0321-20121206/6107_1 /TAXON_ID=163516 /ORGANISM="Leptocylindrus danicus var. danicus, Strain B650" /LENGTH=586 /DNA_ID=CAMNT_0003483749 /DNA_START=19 /DNA_END=1780 /DNA_ORIENTATION=-
MHLSYSKAGESINPTAYEYELKYFCQLYLYLQFHFNHGSYMFPVNNATEEATTCNDSCFRLLQDAQTAEERIIALEKAILIFNHIEEIEHNCAVDRGYGEILCWRLQTLLLNNSSASSSLSSSSSSLGYSVLSEDIECEEFIPEEVEEVAKTISVLEIIHRCTAEKLQESFDSIHAKLIPLLFEAIERYMPLIIHYNSVNDWPFIAVSNCVKLVGYFSTLVNGHILLDRHTPYLNVMLQVLSFRPRSADDVMNDVLFELLSTYPFKHKLLSKDGCIDLIISSGESVNSNMEMREGSIVCLLNLLELEEAQKTMVLNDNLLVFFIAMLKEPCCPIAERRDIWMNYHAAKAAQLLCTPAANADKLCRFENGVFVRTLVNLVMADCEAWNAACGLCHLANNSDLARNSMLHRPDFIDILAKTALSNSNRAIAAEALSKLLPNIDSFDTYTRIIRLMTIRSNFCMNAAVEAILEKMSVSEKTRILMASDDSMISILIEMTRNHKNTYVMSQATKAILLFTLEDQCKDKIRGNQDILCALCDVVRQAKIGESSKCSDFHASAAYATVALCNLCVDVESDNNILTVLIATSY